MSGDTGGVGGVLAVWAGGSLVDPAAPLVSPLDHGLLVGDGAFETLKVVAGRPFALTRHLARLRRTAEQLDLPLPPEDELRGAVEAVVAAGGPEVGRLRITTTSGPGPLGSARGPGPPTCIVVAATSTTTTGPAHVVTVPWPRNERGALAGLKTVSYAENVRALAVAAAAGASEALVPNTRGDLCEGTGSNVFVALGGRLLTPPLSSGCLAGVTRELLLEVVRAEEADLPMSVLERADEVLLTSSTRDVQAVASVDGRPLRSAPGPLTEAAAAAFAAAYADVSDP